MAGVSERGSVGVRTANDGSRPARRPGTSPGCEVISAASSTHSACEPKRYDPPVITIRPPAISFRQCAYES